MKINKLLTLFITFVTLVSLTGVVPVGASSQQASSGATQTYIVLYKSNSVSSDAASVIAKAGGRIVRVNKLGIATVTSFKSLDLLRCSSSRVRSLAWHEMPGSTKRQPLHWRFLRRRAHRPRPPKRLRAPRSIASPTSIGPDPLSPCQWDMRAINAIPHRLVCNQPRAGCQGRRDGHWH